MAAVMSHLNHVQPEDAIVSNGAGNYAVWVHQFYQYREPRTQLAPTCGAHAERVETDEAFPDAFERACRVGWPALIELRVDARQITPRMRID